MRVIYWDYHADEFWRVKSHLAAAGVHVERHIGETPPVRGNVILLHEGQSMISMPRAVRSRCILSLCVMLDPYLVRSFKSQGYRHAIFKHPDHAQVWGSGGLSLRPFCTEQPVSTGDGDVVSLIKSYQERDKERFDIARQIDGLKMYGAGRDQLGFADDSQVLQRARFLVHIKHIGYLCNSVVKALSQGVPILTDMKTLDFGYDDLLVPGVTCIASDDINVLKEAIHMPEERYQELRANCLALRERLTTPDIPAAEAVADVIKRIAKPGW